MNEQRAVIQQMVDALDHADELLGGNDTLVMNGAAAGRWLLEQPAPVQEPEPVAWMFQHDETGRMNYVGNDGIHNPTMFLEMNPRYALVCPLYTTPPAAQKPWVGLTEEERNDLEDFCKMIIGKAAFDAIESKLREKNT